MDRKAGWEPRCRLTSGGRSPREERYEQHDEFDSGSRQAQQNSASVIL